MKNKLFYAILISIIALTNIEANAQEISTPVFWQFPAFQDQVKNDTLTIRIFGDLMMHQNQIDDAKRTDGTYDFSSYFTHIQKYLDNSDLNIGNLEFTLGGKPYTGYPAFSAPDEYARHITDCGFNVFLTANNHICDKYSAGMTRTLKIYRELAQSDSIVFTGTAGNQKEFEETTPLIIVRKGIRIAIINATYGTNIGSEKPWPKTNYLRDKKMLKDALIKAKENADIVVVFPHWGDEYFLTHNSRQESEAKWFAENGADIIIGAHPHVVQDAGVIEVKDTTASDGIKKVPVVYSLGNAISNMSAENTQIELMATLKITKNKDGEIKHLPLEFTYLWSSRPGGYCNHYTMLPVKDQIGKSNEWIGKWEYDKMMTTYNRVKQATKIKEQ
jgi:poly-gamma-glutamate synthesis protein (capsule biosynthesis protein)